MNSLVDYGTSSSSSSDDTEDECQIVETLNVESKSKLPKPTLGGNQSSINNSVFSNPFAQAEMAKAAILEKHVKMVPGKDHVQTINGKKICWNFRKGRCRFGHNCKFAHDTDVQKTDEELELEKQKTRAIVCEGLGTNSSYLPPTMIEDGKADADDVWEGTSDRRKLKRPGLSQTLIPGKKVLKMYKEQQLRDSVKK